jgi:hypothetical protein
MSNKGYLKPFCFRGHPLTEENVKLHLRARGYVDRICRACARENAARWRAAHPEVSSIKNKRKLGLLPPPLPRTHFNCGHLFTTDNISSYIAGKTGKEVKSCRACARAKNIRRADKNRECHLKRNFQMTLKQYEERLASQGGVCANPRCKSPKPGGMGEFHVDHDHACCPGKKSCGKCIRGLLCQACNSVLGRIHDNAEILLGLVDYLKGAF